jgi:predicted PurR-regulated permease PerM
LTSDDAVRWGAAGAALILLGFLLLSLHEVLNPPLLYLALVGALLPLRRSPGFLAIVLTAGALTLFWLLRELGFLLAPFVLAIVLAYILNPAVNRLASIRPLRRFDERWEGLRVGRTGAILLLALPVAGGFLALLIWGVPYLAGELQAIARRTPELIERLANSIDGFSARLGAISVPGFDGGAFAQRVAELDADAVVRFFEDRREMLQERIWEGVLGLGRGLGTVLSMLGYLVLAPVLIFYLLRDYDRLLDAPLGPHPSRAEMV